MVKAVVPHFHNNGGVRQISIGVKEFMCVGATDPFDHPHVYLELGSDGEKICPYCSTLFKFDSSLHSEQSIPANCILTPEGV